MAIALHPYLIGVPHRIGAFDAALKYICKHKKVWKATGSEIAAHYLAQLDGGTTKSRPRKTRGRRTAMKLFRTVLAALLLGPALLAAPAARAADDVTIGTVGSASANIWPVFIGIKKGFFDAENLKVDIVYVQSSANLVQQLAAGSLDITMSTGLVDPIRAIDQKRAAGDRAPRGRRRRPMRCWRKPRSRS